MNLNTTNFKSFLIYIFIIQITACRDGNIKLKELELKERELNLKEREIESQKKTSPDFQKKSITLETNKILLNKSDLISSWIPTHAPTFSITFKEDNTFVIAEDGIDEKIYGNYSYEPNVIKMNYSSGELISCTVAKNQKWGICINFNNVKLRRQ